ncbi:MAG TPA: glycosyltransferase family 39 protein [Acidimicrobiales bacterium]|nr:glycosyltransferase family 39 protein [Acidimicrobiales bacterium]
MHQGQRSETSAVVEQPAAAAPTVDLGGESGGPEVVLEQVRARPTAWQVAAAAAVVLGVVLRFVSRSHLWLDEALSVSIAELPLGSISEALRHDGAPPLYYLLLHGWMEVFGASPLSVRALSGVSAVAALPLIWLAGMRVGGRKVAVTALLLLAASPFAIRYASEARMYSLLVLLALAGWLALDDLLERFSWSRAVVLALATGLLLLTHYWAFYVLAVAAVVVGRRAWRGPNRAEARRAAVAMAAGTTLFLPWVPSFLYQMRNTGTPWAGGPTLRALLDTVFHYAGGFWDPGFVLGLVFFGLIVLALFGDPVDGHRIVLDLRARPRARVLLVAGFGPLALAVVAAMLSTSAFAARYTAVIFPFVLLLVALGTAALPNPRVHRGVVTLSVVLGFVAVFPGTLTEKTNAPRVAQRLMAEGQPGDVVAYCPDQVGPSVALLLPPDNQFVHLTFPSGGRPERVDWVGYEKRNESASTADFTQMLLDRAGPARTIWVVWAPGYRTFGTRCELLIDRLTKARPEMDRVVKLSRKALERTGLVRFRPG